jgi:type I restriction enzyme, S subunit
MEMNNLVKPYDRYKRTGLFWLDTIPLHWNWLYLSQVCKEQQIKNFDNLESNVLSLSYGNIIRKKNIDFGLVPKEYNTYQIVNPGNIIMRLTDLQNDKKSLRTGLVKEKGIITSAYTCLSTDNNPSFIHYLLHSFDTIKVFYGMGGGVRQSIGFNDIRRMRLPIPPKEEQERIVRYLDWKLAKISKLIRAKKQQINLLKEKIDNMTNRASAVDGINKQRLVNVSTKIGIWIERKENQEYVPIGLLNRGRGIFHKSSILGSDLGDSEFYEVEDNALIFSGQFAWEGAVALTEKNDEKCIASHRYYMLRGIEGVAKNKYLWAFFCTKYGELLLNLNSRGAAGRNRPLNMNSLLKERIPLPPIEVQEEISKEVTLLLHFVKAVNYLEKFVIEYRASLIFNVVTGKADVRNIEIEDVAEEAEGFEDIDEEMIDEGEIEIGEEE